MSDGNEAWFHPWYFARYLVRERGVPQGRFLHIVEDVPTNERQAAYERYWPDEWATFVAICKIHGKVPK